MARYVVAALVLLWAAASIPIGLAIWPPAAGSPPGRVLPVLMLVGAVEGAAFALGIVFLVLGGRLLRAVGRWTRLSTAAYVGIAWLLVSWWPHDGLHRSGFGQTFTGLAAVDVAFHTTLIVATGVVTVFYVRTLRSFSASIAEAPPAARPQAT